MLWRTQHPLSIMESPGNIKTNVLVLVFKEYTN